MAQRPPRVVAELGRPETAGETAQRKAAFSAAYRSSKTTRNLIAALIVIVAVVAVIYFAVPRGAPAPVEPVDVTAAAQRVAESEGRPAIAPDASDYWIVNRARIQSEGSVRAWTIVYAPVDEDERGFLRVAQGFDADAAWPARVLSGAAPQGTVTIDGIVWDRFDLDASRTGNISVALSTAAGPDTVLIYGIADDAVLEDLASAVSAEIPALREDSE